MTRLRMVFASPKLILYGSFVLEQAMNMRHLLCRLLGALQEIQDGMIVFNGLQPNTPIPASFMEESRALSASTSILQDRFSVVIQDIGLSSLPFVLESTYHA